jgi:ATP-independent RNA helicase DbpA
MGLDGADIGKIAVHPAHVYVAVRQALRIRRGSSCKTGKLKVKPAAFVC